MSKLKIKTKVKEAEQFVKKFWNSAVAKMPGKSKSATASAAPVAPPPARTSVAPPPSSNAYASHRTSAPPVEETAEDPYQNVGLSTPPPVSTDDDAYISYSTDPNYGNNPDASNSPPPPPPQTENSYANHNYQVYPDTGGTLDDESTPSAPPENASEGSPYNTDPTATSDASAQQSPPPSVNPLADEYQQLSKQVETEVYKLARMLPDIKSQSWRERLVQVTNKAHQKQPDYAGAITDLKQIQQDLNQQRGPLEQAAYDESRQRFERVLRHEAAQILGDRAVPLGKAYLNTVKDVISGKVAPDKALPVIEKLTRDLRALTQKRMQAILAVTADYERIQPSVSRAAAALAQPAPSIPAQVVEGAQGAFAKLDQLLKRVPIIKQFFPKGTPAHAPPPPPPSPLANIQDAIAEGFKDGLQAADLDELKRNLAELERLSLEVIKNMDLQSQLRAQQDRLPVEVSNLTLTDKKLGTGNFADTYIVTAPNVPPMAAKVLKDVTGEAELDKEAEVYARLGEHPNIAKCYGKQKLPGGEIALVMEVVEGNDMHTVFNQLAEHYNGGSISREDYLGAMQEIIHGILMGLAEFEALGLAHRDIKSDNIRFDPKTGQPKILDMGLVADHGDSTQGNLPIKWAPPEALTGDTVGPQYDSFGLGQTLHQHLERDARPDWDAKPQTAELQKETVEPWQVQPQTDNKDDKGRIAQGNFFHPGLGTAPPGAFRNSDVISGGQRALDDQGRPTVMPLTQASDQKTGGEQPGARAPAADPGKFGVETAYVDFMNKLMHPDPAQRLSPSEALRHPFMTERLGTPGNSAQLVAATQGPPPETRKKQAPSQPNQVADQSQPIAPTDTSENVPTDASENAPSSFYRDTTDQ